MASVVGSAVGSADSDGESVGSTEDVAGSTVVGVVAAGVVVGAISVTFGVGRTSDLTLLRIEVIGARGSSTLRVRAGSLELVTIPVGARRIPSVLVDASGVSEVTRPDEVGSGDGLAGSDEAISEGLVEAARVTDAGAVDESAAESVGAASVVDGSVLVGRTMVDGTPAVEPTLLPTSAALPLDVGRKTGVSTKLTAVVSVEGGTTTVL